MKQPASDQTDKKYFAENDHFFCQLCGSMTDIEDLFIREEEGVTLRLCPECYLEPKETEENGTL